MAIGGRGAITMSAAAKVTANIDGIVTVDNGLSDPTTGGAFEVNVRVSGLVKLQDQGLGEESLIVHTEPHSRLTP
jgi:hypothetical protein